ncbi:nucleotidyltransferase family protein [Candidatus Woesearchaeota archaeon]|nr:nucleotidyltransferase family protein [Candidatus Woesearchaeota archaeon]
MNRTKILKNIVIRLRKKGAVQIALFGSYARGEERKNSDIDILVKFNKQKSLMEFVKIEQDLSEVVGKKIDLLTEKSISPHLIGKIKKEMVKLY